MNPRTAPNAIEQDASATGSQRLVSWKEIAAYFNCDVRTVKRWERERGLPVHRVPGGERSRVFAYAAELKVWLHSPPGAVEPSDQPAPPNGFESPNGSPRIDAGPEREKDAAPASAPSPGRRLLRNAAVWVCALVVVAGGLAAYRIYSARTRQRHRNSANGGHSPLPAARALYLKGRYYLEKRTSESMSQAVDAFTQAIVLDSNYAEAYAGLAECYDLMPEYTGMAEADAMPRAMAAARKAIALNDSLPNAHSALAFALFWYRWDFKDAEAEYRRAIALDPRNVEAHHWYATALMSEEKYPQALQEIDTSQQLDPASRSILADQAAILYQSGRREPAIATLEQLQAAEPGFFSPPHYLANIYFHEENYPAYLAELKMVAAATKKDSDAAFAASAADGWAKAGARGLLAAIRAIYERSFATGQDDGVLLAQVCARQGDLAAAVKYLKAASAVRDYNVKQVLSASWTPQLNGYPPFEALRSQIRKELD